MHRIFVFVCAILVVCTSGQGCAQDGTNYQDGNSVVVGCITCQCNEGNIECPSEPTCPRDCNFRGKVYTDGLEWEDYCNTCRCKDGTITCDSKECPDSCEALGMELKKGDIYHRDCNTCECLGFNQFDCTDNICYCKDRHEKIIDTGFFKDESCNNCICAGGAAHCDYGHSCFASCKFESRLLVHDEKQVLNDYVSLICNDGKLEVASQ